MRGTRQPHPWVVISHQRETARSKPSVRCGDYSRPIVYSHRHDKVQGVKIHTRYSIRAGPSMKHTINHGVASREPLRNGTRNLEALTPTYQCMSETDKGRSQRGLVFICSPYFPGNSVFSGIFRYFPVCFQYFRMFPKFRYFAETSPNFGTILKKPWKTLSLRSTLRQAIF